MSSWSPPALLAAVLIGLHYLTLRAASGRIGPGYGALALEGSAAIGILLLLALRLAPVGPTTTAGLAWSCLSGLCISGATTLLFQALRLGGPVSATGTLVLGGGVVLAALLAPLLFGETFPPRRILGVALGLAAVALLATDRT